MTFPFDKDGLAEEIKNALPITDSQASELASDLVEMQPKTRDLFAEWLLHRIAPELTINGFSFANLCEKFGMSPYTAFLTLDWLLREPEYASEALNQGYDDIE